MSLTAAAQRAVGNGRPMLSENSSFSTLYRRYVLSMITAVLALSHVDRGLMALLLQPIKNDLHLTDTQLGFLTGIAFALFYATLGVPIARWADRGNRVTIASLAVGFGSLAVMTILLVTSYWQLVCARVAAAIGDAGGNPPTYSLVGDYFPSGGERTSAMAVYLAGSSLASLVSFILGGWLNEHYGWRAAFFLVGVPGVLLAIIFKLTIAEPRARMDALVTSGRTAPSLGALCRTLWNLRSYRLLAISLILVYALSAGLAPWYAAFLMRSHGMGTAELGIWLGLCYSLGGTAGLLAGGYLAARWFRSNEAGQMRMSAISMLLLLPCYLVFLLSPQRSHALAALLPQLIVLCICFAPAYALMQRLVPDEMRATSMAVVMLLANLIGMGMGPQTVGVLSDLLAPRFGADSLRYAMLAMSLLTIAAAVAFWKASGVVQPDLEDREYQERNGRPRLEPQSPVSERVARESVLSACREHGP